MVELSAEATVGERVTIEREAFLGAIREAVATMPAGVRGPPTAPGSPDGAVIGSPMLEFDPPSLSLEEGWYSDAVLCALMPYDAAEPGATWIAVLGAPRGSHVAVVLRLSGRGLLLTRVLSLSRMCGHGWGVLCTDRGHLYGASSDGAYYYHIWTYNPRFYSLL